MRIPKIILEPSGQPRPDLPRASSAEVSTAENADLAWAVVDTESRCCLRAVRPRERTAWESLFGPGCSELLDALIATGDTLDRAGTRIWCAIEFCLMVLESPQPEEIAMLSVEGLATLFQAKHPLHGAREVLTTVVSLDPDPGREHVLTTGPVAEPRTASDAVPASAEHDAPGPPYVRPHPDPAAFRREFASG
jgi:hypothetical protein